jgi:quercetin dioxygenase-like cupin family protein
VGDQTVIRQAGEGQAFWMLGGLYEVLLSSDETGGKSTVMQLTVPAGMGPPPHSHAGSESVYVAEGTLNFHIGGKSVPAGPGSVFHIPEGTVENFEATSTVRIVATYSPGGIEKFFAEVGEPAQARELPPPPDSPPDVARIAEIGARHGVLVQQPSG